MTLQQKTKIGWKMMFWSLFFALPLLFINLVGVIMNYPFWYDNLDRLSLGLIFIATLSFFFQAIYDIIHNVELIE